MTAPLQPEEIFEVLARHRVRYVLIGGLAAVLHGSSALTNDADVCPEHSVENLERLAAALREMDSRVRTQSEPDGLQFACDAPFLARMKMVNLITRFGQLDVSFEPAGFRFEELDSHAVDFVIAGTTVRVAALRDVIRSKELANRAKDHATLPILYALEDEIEGRSGTR